MKIKLDEGAKVSRAHEADAGLDLCARETKIVPARGSAIFDTGVHVEIPRGAMGLVLPKSGLNVKHSVVASVGVIDAGYTGSIVAKLYNHGKVGYEVEVGDKICQLVFVPIFTPVLEVVDELEDTERGENGFGSSGR